MMRGSLRTLFALLVLAAPAGLQAQPFGSGGGYNYSVNTSDTNTITLIGYDGPAGSITIPANINGLTVSGIGSGGTNEVFADTGVTIVVIPGSVLSIGAEAFAGCASLTSFITAGSVTNVGAEALADCSYLASVYFNGNAPSAAATAFNSDTNATVYYLARSVGWVATFAGLPAVSSTPQEQFTYTTNAGTITMTGFSGGGDAIIPDAINGLLVTSIGTITTYSGPGNASLTIPYSVTNIGAEAFAHWGYQTSISIPGSLSTIGEEAFADTGMTSVTIGYGVTSIGEGAFQDCGYLNVVTIPDSITSIGANAFNGAALDSLTIPGSVTNLGAGAFAGTLVGNVTIPGSVISIGEGAFGGCEFLSSVTIENGVTSIGDDAFEGSNLGGSLRIPDSVTNIGATAFNGTGLSSVTIPGSVTSIGYGAFYNCFPLANVIIEDGVTGIGAEAFGECNDLRTLIIPDSVTSIGADAFSATYALASVTIPGSLTNVGAGAFANTALTNIFFTGNAPSVGADSFTPALSNVMTAYYLPGTTGWEAFSKSAGIPSVLWNPLIQAGGANFGVQNNQFGFTITNASTTKIPIEVEACTNLTKPVWVPLQSLTLSNSFYFSDPDWTNYSARFYVMGFP